MAAAIAMDGTGRPLRFPTTNFLPAQAVVGIVIARVVPLDLFTEAGRRWPLFLAAVASVLAACSGSLMTRWRLPPGTAAGWGTFPAPPP